MGSVQSIPAMDRKHHSCPEVPMEFHRQQNLFRVIVSDRGGRLRDEECGMIVAFPWLSPWLSALSPSKISVRPVRTVFNNADADLKGSNGSRS